MIDSVSIIIPAYNEESRIKKTLLLVDKYFSDKKIDHEIIVVDDGCLDKTAAVCRNAGIENLKVIGYPNNRGKGFAVNYGVNRATKQFVLFVDADNSTPIGEFERLAEYSSDFDVVIGSRYLENSRVVVKQPLSRIIGARLGNLLIQILLLPGFPDTQCGFKLFKFEAAKKIFAHQTIWRWGFDIEILYIARKQGLKIKQVPVDWYNNIDSKIVSGSTFFVTLGELLSIKWRSLRGMYKH